MSDPLRSLADDQPMPLRKVPLIGGISGTGKPAVARQLGPRLGWLWLPVDLLRLAFQHSHATLPRGTTTPTSSGMCRACGTSCSSGRGTG